MSRFALTHGNTLPNRGSVFYIFRSVMISRANGHFDNMLHYLCRCVWMASRKICLDKIKRDAKIETSPTTAFSGASLNLKFHRNGGLRPRTIPV
jgi:hypothetical protein